MGAQSDILQGTLDLLILRTLKSGSFHGYAIAGHIQRVSDEALRVEEGSRYPALHRIEQRGWMKSEWKISERKRRARFYSLTPAGRRQLVAEEQKWERVTAAVAKVLQFA